MKTDYHGRWWDAPSPAWEQVVSLQASTPAIDLLSELNGRFVWVYFGYLHCDGFCQQQWVTLFHLMQQLGADDRVAVLLVSIDPQRDSVSDFQQLAQNLGKQFFALVPESWQKAQWLANEFHAPFQKDASRSSVDQYLVQHAGEMFLVAPDGRVKLVYSGQEWRYDQLYEDYLRLISTP